MSRSALALSAITAGVVALLTGCSGDDAPPVAYPVSVGPHNYTEDPSGWANDFCTSAAPLQGQIASLAALADSSDTEEWGATAQAALTDLTNNLRATAGNMDELGPPPIDADGAEDLYNQLINLLNTFADVFETINGNLDEARLQDVDAPAEVTDRVASAVSDIKAELDEQGGAVAAAFNGTPMQEAFAAAPACQGFGL
jgi:hypothetical protein